MCLSDRSQKRKGVARRTKTRWKFVFSVPFVLFVFSPLPPPLRLQVVRYDEVDLHY